ncbi:MAG: hypothetical protein LBN26_00010 [Christensenellaceae bacterium]|jgi:hypothetical protein|nr:hypothetical protein [Christensenellaceae bacterium]
MKIGVCFVAIGLVLVMLLTGCAASNPRSDAAASSVSPEKTGEEETDVYEPLDVPIEEETDSYEYIDVPIMIGGDGGLFEPLISEIEEGYSGVFENGLIVCFGLGRDYGAIAFQSPESGASGCYVGELTKSGSSLTIVHISSDDTYTFGANQHGDGYRLDLGDLGAGSVTAVPVMDLIFDILSIADETASEP